MNELTHLERHHFCAFVMFWPPLATGAHARHDTTRRVAERVVSCLLSNDVKNSNNNNFVALLIIFVLVTLDE